MADKVASKDIVKTNELGQNVVLVAKGKPVPDDLDERLVASVPQRDATGEQIAQARGRVGEDKARRSSRQKKK